MQRVMIVGSGFAALTSVIELRKRTPDVEITVVSRRPEFVYYPGLIWVPSGRRTSFARSTPRCSSCFHG